MKMFVLVSNKLLSLKNNVCINVFKYPYCCILNEKKKIAGFRKTNVFWLDITWSFLLMKHRLNFRNFVTENVKLSLTTPTYITASSDMTLILYNRLQN